MSQLAQDLRYAVRALSAAPAVTTAAILSLALGIGAATAVFSVVDGVLLKPLPVADQDRLLVGTKTLPARGMDDYAFTYKLYDDLRQRLHTVDGIAAHPYAGALMAAASVNGSDFPLHRTFVTANWFGVLGVRARAGRLITDEDDRTGAAPVVVLAEGLAARLFGEAAGAIGRTVRIATVDYTVIGVAPGAFEFPRGTDAWEPAVRFRDSGFLHWHFVARVGRGFTLDQARADLQAAIDSAPAELGIRDERVRAESFTDVIVGNVRSPLLLLAGAVLLMLVIAGVNVVNLLLVRGLARRREISIRTAIGATKRQIVLQLGTEAAVLAGAGTALSIAVAYVTLHGLLALAPPELPRLSTIAIDGRSLGFACAVAVAAAILFGILPALQATRADPADAMRAPDSSTRRGTRWYWIQQGLVASQIAIAALVLSTAGLLLTSFDRLQRLDPGFTPEEIVLAEISIPPGRYTNAIELQRGMMALAAHAAQLAGIGHATALTTPPFAGNQGVDGIFYGEGQVLDDSANPYVNYEGVDSQYFATLGVPILKGRAIDERDRIDSQPVVVVSESLARLLWGNADPIGRHVAMSDERKEGKWRTVVGLARDTRYRELVDVRPTIYVPYEQAVPVSPHLLAVRATVVTAAAAAIRRAVAEKEPGGVVLTVSPLPRLLAAPLARPRFQSALVTSFAAIGLVLSLVGTYGVLAFFVRQRTREIGIRIALGATPSRVRVFVLRHALTIGTVGVLIGLAGATMMGRLVQPLLFGVTATDPLVLSATGLALLVAIVAATLGPTRSATRTNPLLVLRSE